MLASQRIIWRTWGKKQESSFHLCHKWWILYIKPCLNRQLHSRAGGRGAWNQHGRPCGCPFLYHFPFSSIDINNRRQWHITQSHWWKSNQIFDFKETKVSEITYFIYLLKHLHRRVGKCSVFVMWQCWWRCGPIFLKQWLFLCSIVTASGWCLLCAISCFVLQTVVLCALQCLSVAPQCLCKKCFFCVVSGAL